MASKEETQQAIFDQVAIAASELDGYDPVAKARVLADLALAYRYAAGGAQPGGQTPKA